MRKRTFRFAALCRRSLVIVLFVQVGCSAAADPASDQTEVGQLISQLGEIDEPGFGYSLTFSGTQFLPFGDSGEMGTLIIGAARATPSKTLQAIVERGADAVPGLLRHIDDERPLKMKPVSGMMWMSFDDEYDFNRRTRLEVPAGVNRDVFLDNRQHPDHHALTVGDMCFVALGQIVNRSFNASRYQPTGGVIVSSPTYSKSLRTVIVNDWSNLTRERHRTLLIEDFLKPDSEDRRIGAYLRLALYYPDAVESLVVAELNTPTFDVFDVEKFCRNTLYPTKGKDERKRVYDDFVRKRGAASADGVMLQLFDDLRMSEDREGSAISAPRQLLMELFDKPADVKSKDRPLAVASDAIERARFIAALTHDKSRKVGDLVRDIFLKSADDDDLASACLRCLATRDYPELLIDQLNKINLTAVEVNSRDLRYIEAVGGSKVPAVRAKLFDVVKNTTNEEYFMAALAGVDRSEDATVLKLARKRIDGLSGDTHLGEELLAMIGERYPGEARSIFKSYLATSSVNRAETMCWVLWNGNPIAKDLLAPLLDDKRQLTGFNFPTRVCDHAAAAISQTTKDIKFDSEWSTEKKDAQIVKLKVYCRQTEK